MDHRLKPVVSVLKVGIGGVIERYRIPTRIDRIPCRRWLSGELGNQLPNQSGNGFGFVTFEWLGAIAVAGLSFALVSSIAVAPS